MSEVTKISGQDFEQEVTNHNGVVLVDFYADWCGPCKMIAPVLEQLSKSRDNVKIVKVDADEAPELMAEQGIRGIPTLLLFNQGEKVGTKVGAAPLAQLEAFVDQV
ncbi:thioredoxin [Saccharobesus litoralis]|uniref:Thioredoxin n=1 Tax=Saccharobesus litoralis TaxID=2172099 RepID=A0A2S0VVA9_9ALTE|nr:thioredoxin [Saccharobesus litoralis]AWB68156.1 thioredoxin [Saccharobesus litoralis]